MKEPVNQNNIYEEIGKFIVNFELLITALKQQIHDILHKQGLFANTKSQYCINILLADLGARAIIDKYRSIMFQIFKDDFQSSSKLTECYKCAIKFYEVRNDLVHRNYHIGYTNGSNSQDIIHSFNFKARHKGLNYNMKTNPNTNIQEINIFLEDLINLFKGIDVIFSKKIEFSEFFRNYKNEDIKNIRETLKQYQEVNK